ncbi:MAG: ribosome small subunit-dependent GTPase A [Microbacteriaceae bacterium]|nr:ribosome small subunit-dependent GTPase A [Microbacteriaceae bacterium]
MSDAFDDYEDWDESSVRIRANPRGSRPRSKVRPSHEDAAPGLVIGVDRGRYRVHLPGAAAPITATAARELGRGAVVVGDHVRLVGDTSGAEGSLARIVRVEPRTTLLRRSADDAPTGERDERVIVANADRMLIVVAAADPEPRAGLVDRILVAAVDTGIEPILVVTKTDVADASAFIRQFDWIRVVRSSLDEPPIDELRELVDGHFVVAVGHSGVGKSTLVNALVPEAARATGDVNAVTGRGRHTSSSSSAYPVGDGWIVDTPGVRSFGLGLVDPEHVLGAFADLAAIADDPEAGCPRGCTHLPDAPDCAIVEAVAEGRLGPDGPSRLESLQRLLVQLSR